MTTTPNITTVIFDVGNVLYDWDPRFLLERMTDDAALIDDITSRAITHEWHFQHDAGRDFADTSAELIAQFPQYEAFIRAFGPRFNETIGGPVAGSLNIVRALDARHVPLFAITNFSHEFFPPFHAKHAEIFDRFKDILVSGDERLTKPDPAIYHLAIQRFSIDPATALFVDDRQENAAAARDCGLKAHHFQDAAALKAELEQLGLL